MNRQELIDQVEDDILEYAAAMGYQDVVVKTASSVAGTVVKDDPHGVDAAFSEIVMGEMVQFYQGYLESQVKTWQGELYG